MIDRRNPNLDTGHRQRLQQAWRPSVVPARDPFEPIGAVLELCKMAKDAGDQASHPFHRFDGLARLNRAALHYGCHAETTALCEKVLRESVQLAYPGTAADAPNGEKNLQDFMKNNRVGGVLFDAFQGDDAPPTYAINRGACGIIMNAAVQGADVGSHQVTEAVALQGLSLAFQRMMDAGVTAAEAFESCFINRKTTPAGRREGRPALQVVR